MAADARRSAARRDPRGRHGAREDGAGDRDAPVGARGGGRGCVRADARRVPDERRAAVGRGDREVRAVVARASASRQRSAVGRGAGGGRRVESDVVVTSYDIATRDVEDLCTVAWDRLLLDEAQDVKNPATKRARALRLLPARRRLAMTGTPIENRLQELWALMDIVNPGLVGSREWFERTFAGPIETVQRRARAGAAEVDGAAVHPAAAEGRGRGGARAAADHGGEGLLQADDRAGEPVSRDGRPVDAADRAAREHVQPARRGARDARAAEAGVQPPGDGAARGRRARGTERQARAAGRAAEGGAGRRQVAGVHAVPGLRGARAASGAAAREEGRVLPRAADGEAARRVARRRSRRRKARACW